MQTCVYISMFVYEHCFVYTFFCTNVFEIQQGLQGPKKGLGRDNGHSRRELVYTKLVLYTNLCIHCFSAKNVYTIFCMQTFSDTVSCLHIYIVCIQTFLTSIGGSKAPRRGREAQYALQDRIGVHKTCFMIKIVYILLV